jgi:hypothetical protein
MKGNMDARQMIIVALTNVLLQTRNQGRATSNECVETPQARKPKLESGFLKDEEETFSQQLIVGSNQNSTSSPFDHATFSLSQRNVELASKLSRHLQKTQDEVVAKALNFYWESINNKIAGEQSEMKEDD